MVDILLIIFAVIFSCGILFSKDPIVSAFFLLLTFLDLAGIFYQLGSPFIAAIQILVYAGAIAVLFLFVLMLLNLKKRVPHRGQWLKKISFSLLVVATFIPFILTTPRLKMAIDLMDPPGLEKTYKLPMERLFSVLFSEHFLAFEYATLLLLFVIITVILMMKNQGEEK